MATDDKQEDDYESLWMRLLWMILIAVMLSLSHTVLGVITVLQFIIMIFNRREPNADLAHFGTTLGVWMAKAVRYQTAASEVKPWPWTELD
jgi:hypothetical protein